MSDVITIQPGAGSFTDASGNVFTINANDNDTAEINGQPVTPNGESSKTGALQLNADNVYGQDQSSGQWYLLASKGTPGLWEWQPISAPPDSTSSSGNFVLSPSNSTTTALGNDQIAMVFVADSSGATDASTSSTNNPQAASGILTIQPGAGSFSDPFGNIFMIGGNNTAEINGQPITPNGESSNTGVLQLSSGSVFGQDQNTGQWYQLASKGAPGLWEWQPVSAVPASN